MKSDDLRRPGRAHVLLGALLLVAGASAADADEAFARDRIKAMSDYMAAAETMSLDFDADLGVVTQEGQKLTLVSSGEVVLNRPDKLFVRRHGGFADVEMMFDGETLSLFGKSANVYAELDAPGTIDALFETLRTEYQVPVPGADLLMTDLEDALMAGATELLDLGSGVVGGIECDHFAARGEYADWEIWVAQGNRPYPCMYVITSRDVEGGPQHTWRVSDFRTGAEAAKASFAFDNTTSATKIELSALKGIGDLPEHFKLGEQ